MALLISADSAVPVQVIERTPAGFAARLGCARVERWPARHQLDAVKGPDGKARRFEIWVDEEGLARGLAPNTRATVAAHPLNEGRRRHVLGPAVLAPLTGAPPFTAEDWAQIHAGASWSEEHEKLIEANAAGPSAAKARMG
jgi:hypothetical protein